MFLSYYNSGPGNVLRPPSFLLQVANEVSGFDVRLFLPGEQGDSFIFSLCPFSPVCPGRFSDLPNPWHFPILPSRTMTATIITMLENGVFVFCFAGHKARKHLCFRLLFSSS